jgi:SAM-dependent methyltransferase
VRDHPRYAAVSERMLAPLESAGLSACRQDLLARATGRVLEVGAGTGLNLAHYTAAGSVTVLEPDAAMRLRLAERVGECPAPVTVVGSGIDDADLPDASFDTVVCTLVLCTVPDLASAARRIRGLLAPGGRVLFIEHAAAPGGWGIVQRLLDPLWHRVIPGCHLHRDPTSALRDAGLMVSDYDRTPLRMIPGLIDSLVVGTAMERTAPLLVPAGTYPLGRRAGS